LPLPANCLGVPVASWPKIARRIRVPLGFVFAVMYLWLAHPTTTFMLAGAVFIGAGLVVRALASGYVRKNEQLTTTGPYAYTRNPLYLGSLILAAGFALAARSWWVAGMIVAFFGVVYLPVIRSEEHFLREKFPEFDAYASKVRRLVPRLFPVANDDGAFSWDLYWKHREYNALVGAVAMIALLLLKMRFCR
jgi:protein-S-isoprenylcysteine O-methyltransferase Ste14